MAPNPTNTVDDELLAAIQVSLPMNNDGKIVASPRRLAEFVNAWRSQGVGEHENISSNDQAPQPAVDELQCGIEQYILWQLIYLKRQLKTEISDAQAAMMTAQIARRYADAAKREMADKVFIDIPTGHKITNIATVHEELCSSSKGFMCDCSVLTAAQYAVDKVKDRINGKTK